MIGAPPCTGFASKLFLILASLQATETLPVSGYIFVAVLLTSTLLNLAYFWRVIDRIYFVKSEEGHEGGGKETKKADVPFSMVVPMLILAALCIVVGILWLTKVPLPFIGQVLADLGVGVLPQW